MAPNLWNLILSLIMEESIAAKEISNSAWGAMPSYMMGAQANHDHRRDKTQTWKDVLPRSRSLLKVLQQYTREVCYVSSASFQPKSFHEEVWPRSMKMCDQEQHPEQARGHNVAFEEADVEGKNASGQEDRPLLREPLSWDPHCSTSTSIWSLLRWREGQEVPRTLPWERTWRKGVSV